MAAISKDLWALVAPLLDQALDLEPGERAGLVARLREHSPAAADELAALLAAESSPEVDLLPEAADSPLLTEAHAGRSIDRYTLERPIGRGGMGTVWLAHRSDGRFEGKVAIKLLNLALVGRAGEERFAQEGQVLARLAHPHIARLLDAGVAGAQPFLVLEYVVGRRIDEFADERRATPADRVRLCLQVLDALAIAHANLVIHRDIKPSNILVTADETVKLLDFGIAKLLAEGRLIGEPTTLTDSGGRALTPEYAAPEVILGDPVSAATDVYSTGVLLYWLLAGRHPTGEGCATSAAHLRAVVDTEPSRLSESVTATGPGQERAAAQRRAAARGSTPERLRRLYRGDLDNVLAKALKKAPGERYQTAAEFRDDLRRFLEHQPVAARPDSLGYRARKFARRNRRSLAAGALVAASLIGGTATSLHQMRIAERERDRARDALERSKASTGFESLLFRLIDPGGEAITYRQLLDRGRLALEKEFSNEPVPRMQVGIQFAQNYLREGNDTAAVAVLSRTVTIADSLANPLWQARTRCELAIAQAKMDSVDASQAALDTARRFLARVRDPESGTLNACDQADGDRHLAARHPDSAAAAFQREIRRFVADGDSGRSEYMYALNDYARALFEGRRIRDGVPVLREILALARAGTGGDPQSLPVTQYNTLAALDRLGEYAEMRRFLTREIASGARTDTSRGPHPLLHFFYAQTWERLDRSDSARFWYGRALEQPARLGPTRRYLAERRLARLARTAGDAEDAAQHGRAAREAAGRAQRTYDVGVENAFDELARLYRAPPAGAGLDSAVQRALAAFQYRDDINPAYLAPPLAEAAELLNRGGRYQAAGRYADHLVRMGSIDSLAATQSAAMGEGLLFGARAALGQGDVDRARDLARRSLAPLTSALGGAHRWTREARALADSLGPTR